jgi:hypothetical protein
MEEKDLTEKESLELIARMIQSSKENMEVGRGNRFLYWGYFTVTLSIVVYVLVALTNNSIWSCSWMLMFGFWGFISYKEKKPVVVTYTDKVINQVWRVMGYMFILTFIVVSILQLIAHYPSLSLMMPLSLLYVGIGVSITGIILQDKWLIYSPFISFVITFYMLTMLIIRGPSNSWSLLFGFAFGIMYIIPGHIMNHKAHR